MRPVKESPVNIECKVTQVLELGSHDMFLAKVTAVQVDESLLDEKGKLDLNKAHLVAYSHGEWQMSISRWEKSLPPRN